MKKQTKMILYTTISLLLIATGVVALTYYNSQPSKYDDFATCVDQSGATFYGAYWCPHCNDQKALFGKSASKLPYTECSLPGGQGQNTMCNQVGITAYPTWEFTEGDRVEGVLSLEELSTRTGCPLPLSS